MLLSADSWHRVRTPLVSCSTPWNRYGCSFIFCLPPSLPLCPHEGTVGKTFPAHYYAAVHVCANCYKMYTKINSERNAALAKLQEKELLAANGGRPRTRPGTRGSRPGTGAGSVRRPGTRGEEVEGPISPLEPQVPSLEIY